MRKPNPQVEVFVNQWGYDEERNYHRMMDEDENARVVGLDPGRKMLYVSSDGVTETRCSNKRW